MKKKPAILILFLSFQLNETFAQGSWVWMKGSNFTGASSVYGTQGVPDPTNVPQGFYQAANWIDLQGNFWMFGGLDIFHSETSDLWMFNPSTNMWTWVKGPQGANYMSGVYGTRGVPAPSNNPGSRGWGCVSWTDLQGQLWLYGGYGFDAFGNWGNLSDLWKYDISTNEWAWMQGPNQTDSLPVYGQFQQASPLNSPGGRQECNTAWVDDNNQLWFFGGQGGDFSTVNIYNDLWKFDIGINQWTWMKGPQGGGNPGNYGTLNVEAASNLPPARGTYTRWKDPQGNFYIWGGVNFNTSEVFGDVWRYNPQTNNWTWVAGDNFSNGPGSYQQRCVPGMGNHPVSRGENRTAQMIGCTNIFWSYGGFTYDPFSSASALNDLWTFNTQTNEWTWVSGDNQYNSTGNYGQMGVANPSNIPPAKEGPCLWIDNSGTLWMWGGMDYIGSKYNDMWKFVPDTSCIHAPLFVSSLDHIISDTLLCVGDTAVLNASGLTNFQISPLANTRWVDSDHLLLFPSTTTTYTISAQTSCTGYDTASFRIQVLPDPVASFQVSSTWVNIHQPDITITNNSQNYEVALWFLDGVPITIPANNIYQFTDTGTFCFTLVVANAEGCTDTATECVTVIDACFFASVDDYLICTGDSAVLTVTTEQVIVSPSSGVQWIDSLHAVLKPSADTTYIVTAPAVCSDTFAFAIEVYPYPVADMQVSPLTVYLNNPFVTLANNSTDFSSIGWYLDGTTVTIPSNNIYQFTDTGTYCFTLVVFNTSGCADSASQCVTVFDKCFSASINDNLLCIGDSALLTVSTAQAVVSPSAVQWIDSLHALLKPSANITYAVTAPAICSDTFLFAIEVRSYPVADFFVMPTTINIIHPTVVITNNSLNYDMASWYLENEPITLSPGNTYQFTDTGAFCFSLLATSMAGCFDSSGQCVIVYADDNILLIPSAFTPNSDGHNDYFLVLGTLDRILSFQIQLFNRWGEEIFSSNSANFKWDGYYKGYMQDMGVYAYKLNTLFLGEQKQRSYSGSVTLVK